jgi:nucleoside triphosphate pyrophosphatase
LILPRPTANLASVRPGNECLPAGYGKTRGIKHMILSKAASLTSWTKKQPDAAATARKPVAVKKGAVSRHKLVLASASPRRLALLEQVGIEPTALRPATIDETPKKGERPRTLAQRLAKAKAIAAADRIQNEPELSDAFVLAADTVVAIGRMSIGKPEYLDEAAKALAMLSGRTHKVYTSVCVVTPEGALRLRTVETRVRLKRLSREEIDSYLACGEWRGKAGGYAIQGIAGAFIEKIVGSYSNVVGLPLIEVVRLLAGEGFPVYFNWMNRAEVDAG